MKVFRYGTNQVLPGLLIRKVEVAKNWVRGEVLGPEGEKIFFDPPYIEEDRVFLEDMEEVGVYDREVQYVVPDRMTELRPLDPDRRYEEEYEESALLVFRSAEIGSSPFRGFQSELDEKVLGLVFIYRGENWKAEDGKYILWTGEGFEILDEDPNPPEDDELIRPDLIIETPEARTATFASRAWSRVSGGYG